MSNLEKAAQHFGLFLSALRLETGGGIRLNDAACAELIVAGLDVLTPESDDAAYTASVLGDCLRAMGEAAQLATDNGEDVE